LDRPASFFSSVQHMSKYFMAPNLRYGCNWLLLSHGHWGGPKSTMGFSRRPLPGLQ
jgi:hypothetical protein